jgi:hypothetical protein
MQKTSQFIYIGALFRNINRVVVRLTYPLQNVKIKLVSLILFMFVLNNTPCFSQGKVQSFRKLSRPEKRWVLSHPLIAGKAFRITQAVLEVTHEEEKDSRLDGRTNGGQVDAFRHAYWMAMLSATISMHKAALLGKAHEKGNRADFLKGKTEERALPDSISCAMDLQNNLTGIAIRKAHPTAGSEEIKQFVISNILQGKLVILNMNAQGEFLDCGDKIIDLQAFKGVWSIPKCLVPSNKKPVNPA